MTEQNQPCPPSDRCTCRVCCRLSYQAADPVPAGKETSWVSYMCQLNFVTQMRLSNVDFGEHEGPLSIKSVSKGREIYQTDGVERVVDPNSYLILNHGQRYSSIIESDMEADSYCVWFRPGFTESAMAAMNSPADRLLDDPATSTGPIEFVDRLYPHDDLVSPVLQRMHRAFNEGWSTSAWLEEQFHHLAEGMVRSHRQVTAEIERMPAVRRSTRQETYRRLHRAKDYLDANLTSPVMLSEVATVAWLSPHHFLRQFQQLFGESPRQYQTRRRMEKACDLLKRTDQPVTEICFSLGFESLGSFSWLFRKLHGAPPSRFRALHRPPLSPRIWRDKGGRENGKREEAVNHRSR